MKRNLLKGIILISATALSSCSSFIDLSKTKTLGDDVYYTQAKAGDGNFESQYIPQIETATARNDDYYYYGDYESRINRFSYASPFSYDDDYYYSDASYNPSSYQDTTQTTYASDGDESDQDYDDLGVYSAYDFGYGDFDGYDDFGYGIAYSGFVSGGGTRTEHKKWYSHSNNSDKGALFVRGGARLSRSGGQLIGRSSGAGTAAGLAFNRVNTGSSIVNKPLGFSGARPTGSNTVYPGRPNTNSAIAGVNRQIRPDNQNPRAIAAQRNAADQNSAPIPQKPSSAPTYSGSSGGSSSGGSGGGGGGGRPVRP